MEPLEPRALLADFSAAINFQPDGPAVAAGFDVDAGASYAVRPDGLTYGWDQDVSKRAKSRASSAAPDARYETFIAQSRATWNLAVPNGTYTVHLVAGDGKKGTRARVDVEGVRALDGKASKGVRYLDGYVTVDVADGNLTISPGDRYKGNRLNFVEVRPGPAAGQTYDGEPTVNRPGDLSGLQVVTGTGKHAVAAPLADGAALDLPTGGVVIQAVTVPPVVGSVVFALDGVPFRTDNTAPYSAGGEDANDNPLPLMLTSGPHTLTATPFAGTDGRGAQGAAATVAFTVANSPVTAPPVSVAWTAAAAPVPTERVEGAVARIGTKLYDFGGYSGSDFGVADNYDVFDAATGMWSTGPDFPGAQTHAAVTSDGARYIYKISGQLGGGVPGTPVTDAHVLDTATGLWADLPDVPEARYAAGLAYVDRKLYLIGGTGPDRTAVRGTNLMLDLDHPDAGWQPRAAVPLAGDHTSVEVIDGKVYVVGGEHGHASHLPEDDAPYVQHDYALRYDPAADAWERLADMPQGRSHAEGTSFQANGKIIVMGGKLSATDVSDRIDVYDPATNAWTTSLTTLPKPWQGGAAIYYNGNVHLSHGQEGAPDHTMWHGTWVGSVFGV